jgi:hypothetical protein
MSTQEKDKQEITQNQNTLIAILAPRFVWQFRLSSPHSFAELEPAEDDHAVFSGTSRLAPGISR